MPKAPCARPGCSSTAVCRGLCKPHYYDAYKEATLPPKKLRAPKVLVKVYFEKEQLRRLKALAKVEADDNLSAVIREAVEEHLGAAGV